MMPNTPKEEWKHWIRPRATTADSSSVGRRDQFLHGDAHRRTIFQNQRGPLPQILPISSLSNVPEASGAASPASTVVSAITTFSDNAPIRSLESDSSVSTPTEPRRFGLFSDVAQTYGEKVALFESLSPEAFWKYKEDLEKELHCMQLRRLKRMGSVFKKEESEAETENDDDAEKQMGSKTSTIPPKKAVFWTRMLDEQGNVVYFNKETKEWTLTLPLGEHFDANAPVLPFGPPPPPKKNRFDSDDSLCHAETRAKFLDDKKYKEFRRAIEEELTPILSTYLKHVTSVDDSKKRWLLKKIAGEMAKRESRRFDFDYALHHSNSARILGYANKYLERKIVTERAVDLWKGYDCK